MGLFTVRCTNPDCGHRIPRGTNFCPKCGTGTPTGRIHCGSCGREIRASANFCPYCRAKVTVAAQPEFTADRWARQPEDFATRVDVQDVRGWLIKPLVIEHGTRALLFQQGRLVGELPPGRYDMNGFLQRLTSFMIDTAASVVIVDGGDVPLALENGNLWTADELEVGTTMRLIVRVHDPDALFQNLIKGRGRLLIDDVETALAGEVQMVLAGIIRRYPAERLFPATDVRYEIENQLRDHLRITLKRLGLELVQLRFIDFVGEAYEELRRQRSDLKVDTAKVDLREQRNLLNQRLRELLTQERMDAFKSEKDLENFIRQTEHELGLKDVIRDDEMQRLKERFAFERDREAVLRRLEIQNIEREDVREQAWKDLVAEERARDERHRRRLEREDAEHRKDVEHARDGLELLEKVKEIEHTEARRQQELELERLRAFSEADAQALIAILDGPAAERLMRLEEFRAHKDLSPEQLLAIAAKASPEAAKALCEKYAAEGRLSQVLLQRMEQQLAEQRQVAEGYADRMERIMRTALEQMGGVAATRARPSEPSQTVIAPGPGAPVVVGPGTPATSKSCPKCGAAVPAGASKCPSCSHEFQ